MLRYFLSFYLHFRKCLKTTFLLDEHSNTTVLVKKYCTNAMTGTHLYQKVKYQGLYIYLYISRAYPRSHIHPHWPKIGKILLYMKKILSEVRR